ncbi:MAG: VWA domain-containing protein [Aquidulcibacter sp.]|jgi:Flp pilus assembly protein TadG|uniref:pilus assembly protein TadG-related protein n=1 Tax=Aquidulcibacter sp. TaxID=2052990 RepID=UPI0022BBA5B5|nr:vWA domain-containing protein [Aquidulcibacter sp.]MCZ8210267.1 VWA domain-containing protein [Aquidulcibacter sp.]
MRTFEQYRQKLVKLSARLKNERGTIALTFALSAAALLIMGVGSMQLAMISSGKSKYQAAADTAALAAIAPTTDDDDMAEVAEETFMANLSASERDAITNFSVATETGRVRSALITYSAHQPSIAPGLVGNAYTPISGTARARKADYRYIDVDLWLDGSASMGVAADEAGRDKLRDLSKNDPEHSNCAFACHIPTHLKESNLYSTSEQRAHANGVKLRHDIMKESVQILIDELHDAYPRGLRARYGVARMAATWERQLPFTSDMDTARDFVGTFQLKPGWSSSRLTPALQAGRNTLTSGAGDGSQAKPEKFIIIVTDGMQFDWNAIAPGPIGSTACQELKDNGYRVGVVQLKYVRLDGDGAFEYWVKPYYDQITPALQACASAGYYFHADNPDEVRNAFRQLAKTLEESLRLAE